MTNSRSVLESDKNAKIFAYYQSKRDQSRLPSWADIEEDLFDFPKELPYLYVVDLENKNGGTRFKFRLWGSGIVAILKHEGTGNFVRELPLGGWENELRSTLLHVYKSKRSAVSVDILNSANGLSLELEHLAMPLSDDGANISHILGCIDFLGYDHAKLLEMTQEVNWDELVAIDVPKRLIIANFKLDLKD